jgi:hypothetical protein
MDIFGNSDFVDPRDRLYTLYSLVSNLLDMPVSLASSSGQWKNMAKYSSEKGDDGYNFFSSVLFDTLRVEFPDVRRFSHGFWIWSRYISISGITKPYSTLTLLTWVPDWSSLHERLYRNLDSVHMIIEKSVRACLPANDFSQQRLPH